VRPPSDVRHVALPRTSQPCLASLKSSSGTAVELAGMISPMSG
jgi:hypothetical protein